MSKFEAYRTVTESLPLLTREEEVESLFTSAEISDPKEKKDALFSAMGFDAEYNLPSDDTISPEDEYKAELAIFLEGSWRLLA